MAAKRNYDKPWNKNAQPKDAPAEEKPKTFLYEMYPDGKGPDAGLIESLEREIVQKDINITFDDIAELDDVPYSYRQNKPLKKQFFGR